MFEREITRELKFGSVKNILGRAGPAIFREPGHALIIAPTIPSGFEPRILVVVPFRGWPAVCTTPN
jgi:hypothetical protein